MKQRVTLTFLPALLWLTSQSYADSGELDQPASALPAETQVTVSEAAQQLAGIQASPAQASQHLQEINGFGKAIDLQPLLNIRNRHREALNGLHLAQAALNTAQQALDRYQELYAHGATPLHTLQNQQLQWQNARLQSDAATLKLQAIQAETLLHWGPVLATWILTDQPSKLDAFLNGQTLLLQVSLPTKHNPAVAPTVIFVEASGERSKAQRASLIARTPQNDPNDQGSNYFYQTSGQTIRAGMRVSVWMPDDNQQAKGVSIPASALLWSQQQALVYIKVAPALFRQQPINHYTAINGGYFVTEAIKAGEAVVTTGAQMLLSEQLKQHNPKQDDD